MSREKPSIADLRLGRYFCFLKHDQGFYGIVKIEKMSIVEGSS